MIFKIMSSSLSLSYHLSLSPSFTTHCYLLASSLRIVIRSCAALRYRSCSVVSAGRGVILYCNVSHCKLNKVKLKL